MTIHTIEKRGPGAPKKAEGEQMVKISTMLYPHQDHYIKKISENLGERPADVIRHMIDYYIDNNPQEDQVIALNERISTLTTQRDKMAEQIKQERQNAISEIQDLIKELAADIEAKKFKRPEAVIKVRDERLIKISRDHGMSKDDALDVYTEKLEEFKIEKSGEEIKNALDMNKA